MRFAKVALPALVGLPLISGEQLAARSDTEVLQDLNSQALSALQSQSEDSATARQNSNCSVFNAKVRRDW